ncbi:MAG: hypothetical protein EP344_13385 [Bacteroidetes bacterium]|nr:MAG: hypothetical protein EP344_13385 [Bacteroidota bacterium]
MRTFSLALFSLIVLAHCIAPPAENAATSDLYAQITAPEAAFDSTLATRVGADKYGMRSYVLAYLKAGPNRSQDSLEAAELQKAHLKNITRLAAEGKLVLAGPFLDDGETRGIYIFNVETLEEAAALTETDPAVQAGRLVMELHPWYGSAALPLITPLHKRLEQQSVSE